jgi:hypothetical protein
VSSSTGSPPPETPKPKRGILARLRELAAGPEEPEERKPEPSSERFKEFFERA